MNSSRVSVISEKNGMIARAIPVRQAMPEPLDLSGRMFYVRTSDGEGLPWADNASFRSHAQNRSIQQMIGTDPSINIRDLNYFSNMFYGRSIEDQVKGKNIVVNGFGPKWTELFLPHLNKAGDAVSAVAAEAANVWGFDFLEFRVKNAADAVAEYLGEVEQQMSFPGIKHGVDLTNTNPYQREVDIVCPDMFKVFSAEEMIVAGEKIRLCHSAIESIPSAMVPDGSAALITATGVFDADPLGLEGYNAEHENPQAVRNVRNIFSRLKRMLCDGGLLMIGRGDFVPGSYYALHRVFEKIAADFKLSMVYMYREDAKYRNSAEFLFGFVKDGIGDLILMGYPFPDPEYYGSGCLGGYTEYPEWVHEAGFINKDHRQE